MVPKVLIEDDPTIRGLLLTALKRQPLLVEGVGDGAVALEKMRVSRYSVVVLDLMMPRMNGGEFLDTYVTVTTDRPVIIVVTAFGDSAARSLVRGKAHVILRKPFDLNDLVAIIRDCAVAHLAATFEEPQFAEDQQGGRVPTVT
jgi:DNA-binding response OmpR family regulator